MFDPSFSFRFPPADERRFVAWYDECYAPQRPLTIRLGTAAYAAIGGFDVAFAVRDLPKVLIVRAIVTVALIAAYWLHVRGHLLATQNSLAIATTIAGLGLIVIDRLAYVDRDHSYLPTGLMQVMLFGAMSRLRVSFLGPIAGILAIAAAASVATAFHTGPGLFERLLVLDTGIAISLQIGRAQV